MYQLRVTLTKTATTNNTIITTSTATATTASTRTEPTTNMLQRFVLLLASDCLLFPTSRGECCEKIMVRTRLAGGKETIINTPTSIHQKFVSSNSPANEVFDPTVGCPSNGQEWDIYWELMGFEIDSTISVTCVQEGNSQSVRIRPRTPSTEPQRNISSNFSQKNNISGTFDNRTSTTSTELSPKELTTGFMFFIVLIFIGITFFITFLFTSERVNPEQSYQEAENPVFLNLDSHSEEDDSIYTR